MLKTYLIVIGIMSLVELILFAYDKIASNMGWFRIPVYTLLIPIGFGGAIGALISMLLFRHKTRKMFFTIPVCFSLIIQVGLLMMLIFI